MLSEPGDVRDLLKIDKYQLDEELVLQPQIVFDVSVKHVEAMSTRDSLKNAIKEAEAEARQRIEEEAETKLTVAAINSLVDVDERVVSLNCEYEDAVRIARLWDAAFEALKQRGYALHKLVDLHLAEGAAIAGQTEGTDRRKRRVRDAERAEADADVQDARRKRRRRINKED